MKTLVWSAALCSSCDKPNTTAASAENWGGEVTLRLTFIGRRETNERIKRTKKIAQQFALSRMCCLTCHIIPSWLFLLIGRIFFVSQSINLAWHGYFKGSSGSFRIRSYIRDQTWWCGGWCTTLLPPPRWEALLNLCWHCVILLTCYERSPETSRSFK